MRALVAACLGMMLCARGALAQEPDPAPPSAGTWTSKGELALEGRAFLDDDDARTVDHGAGMFGRLELRYTRLFFEAKARGYGRLDRYDHERTVAVPEEAWVQARLSRLRLRAGIDILNWTATEAMHPADIINARNLDSDLENLEKIGEPMAEFQVRPLRGMSVEAFLMPYYTSPILPSPASRLSFAPPGLDLRDRKQRLDGSGHLTGSNFGPQAALQIRQVAGPVDLTIHVVRHMDRSQPYVLIDPATFQPVLLFQTVNQLGGTAQFARGPMLAKLEWSVRRFVDAAADAMLPMALPNRNHGTVAGGLEWNLPHDNGSESTLILEGQAILGVDKDARRLLTPFQRDVFAGLRFAANDTNSHECFAGGSIDLQTFDEFLFSASCQQRLGETWTVKAGVRVFGAPTPPAGMIATGLAALRNADHVRLTLTRHF